MDFTVFIPITLFICIVWIVKLVTDSRLRRRLSETHASEDLVKAMFQSDEINRRHSALKWGLVLVLVGAAFGLIDGLNLDPDDPATYGILFAASGLGLLGYHLWISKQRS
jgi:hypothetical protein